VKKTLKSLTVGTLLATMAFGVYGVASAESGKEEGAALAKATAVSAAMTEGKKVIIYHRSGSLLQNPAHERNYLLLLVKAYAPGSVEDWKVALEERKRVESDMPKPPLLEKKMILQKDMPTGDGKMELRQGVPADGVQVGEDGANFRIGLNKDDMKEIMVPGQLKDDIIKKELPEDLKLQEDLAKAVEAGDDAAIKELMPKLLEAYIKQTADLKVIAEKLKNAEAAAQADKGEGK
jgi:hypothetical protein